MKTKVKTISYLYSPEEKIVGPGGDVILLVKEGRCIGTCALIP